MRKDFKLSLQNEREGRWGENVEDILKSMRGKTKIYAKL